MAKAVDSGGDVCVQAPVDDSGGAAPVQAEEGSDVANNIDGEYGVPVDEEAEVAEYIDEGGAIQVPVDEGGGAVPVRVHEGGDMTKDVGDDGTNQVQVPVEEGGGTVQFPVAE